MKSVKKFEKTVNSEMYEVRLLITEAMQHIDLIENVSDEKRNDIRLVISELLINALYHGNKNRSSKKIRLSVELFGSDFIIVQVEDEGKGLNRRLLKEKRTLAEKRKSSTEEGGRGLMLISGITGSLFTRCEGRRVCVKIKLEGRGMKQ